MAGVPDVLQWGPSRQAARAGRPCRALDAIDFCQMAMPKRFDLNGRRGGIRTRDPLHPMLLIHKHKQTRMDIYGYEKYFKINNLYH
jgi:hypothetical protein